eukprot:COSAG01_NODE_2862_length_6958_cov_21.483015_3_plen_253_part_00
MARPCYLGLMMSVVCLTALNTPTQVRPPRATFMARRAVISTSTVIHTTPIISLPALPSSVLASFDLTRPAAQVTAQKPPNCPQLLAQAQQKMAAATKALDAANAKLNTTLPSLTQMVTLAHQNETTWGTKYNAAMTTYANAISQHAAAVNGLNLAEASLNETVSLCKQPVKPPNCPDLLKKAQDTVNSDKTNLVNTVTALNTATAAKNAVQQPLSLSCLPCGRCWAVRMSHLYLIWLNVCLARRPMRLCRSL